MHLGTFGQRDRAPISLARRALEERRRGSVLDWHQISRGRGYGEKAENMGPRPRQRDRRAGHGSQPRRHDGRPRALRDQNRVPAHPRQQLRELPFRRNPVRCFNHRCEGTATGPLAFRRRDRAEAEREEAVGDGGRELDDVKERVEDVGDLNLDPVARVVEHPFDVNPVRRRLKTGQRNAPSLLVGCRDSGQAAGDRALQRGLQEAAV